MIDLCFCKSCNVITYDSIATLYFFCISLSNIMNENSNCVIGNRKLKIIMENKSFYFSYSYSSNASLFTFIADF